MVPKDWNIETFLSVQKEKGKPGKWQTSHFDISNKNFLQVILQQKKISYMDNHRPKGEPAWISNSIWTYGIKGW